MKKYFCSADIHSFYDEWVIALNRAGFDLKNPEHNIIICGDLFDRGSQTLECYEFVKDMITKNRLIYIRGNHEDLLIECMNQVKRGKRIDSYHKPNGTIKTLSHMLNCSEYDILCNVVDSSKINSVTGELFDFIDKHCVDYFELGDKVFVHGWVPTTCDENRYEIVHENWRDGDWREARWTCCFDAWLVNLTPPDKTVVCGHWHTSYGWHLFRGRSEWGPDAEFTPFIAKGIIALDACTVDTHMVNVVVFDEGGDLLE